MFAQADAARLPFTDDTFNLTFTSPPYCDARTYGIGANRSCGDWIDWMMTVVAECVRVTNGLVLINCAGVTRDWCYQPGPEGLLYEWWRRGGRCWRPAYWHRVGIPGSGGKQWLRADIEYVLAFTKCEAAIPWSDNTANGHPPKVDPGGDPSHRAGGKMKSVRRCTRGKSGGDTIQENAYIPPTLANPGVLIQGIKVGGGRMGHTLAHENEAPFPIKLAQWFIRSHCPPGGLVLDPFSGSGTTVHAAASLGRRGVGCDLRFSQCELGRRRNACVQAGLFD